MDDFAQLGPEERRLHFEQAAAQRGIAAQIIEKDFWVCWSLRRLHSLIEFRDHMTFKGGTSLSKVFGAIEWFSEDVDVAIERDFLGFGSDNEPEKGRSGKEQQRRVDALKEACQRAIAGRLMPQLTEVIAAALGDDTNWTLTLDPSDPDQQSLLFQYPSALRGSLSRYFASSAKIEFGARSDHFPVETGPGIDSFTYRIAGSSSEENLAAVTLGLADSLEDVVKFRVEVVDLNGNPVSSAPVGALLELWVFVEALPDRPNIEPVLATYAVDSAGVAAEVESVLAGSNEHFLVGPRNISGGDSLSFGSDIAYGAFRHRTDADGDTLTARIFREPRYGHVTLNADGSFRYVQDANSNHGSRLESFSYIVDDGVAARVGLAMLALPSGEPVPASWQNPENPIDVDGDGVFTSDDEWLLVHDLETNGERELPPLTSIKWPWATRSPCRFW